MQVYLWLVPEKNSGVRDLLKMYKKSYTVFRLFQGFEAKHQQYEYSNKIFSVIVSNTNRAINQIVTKI